MSRASPEARGVRRGGWRPIARLQAVRSAPPGSPPVGAAAVRAAAASLMVCLALAGCAGVPSGNAPQERTAPRSPAPVTPPVTSGTVPIAPEAATGWTPKALVRGGRDMVATANPHATDAAVRVLADGGSAVDAAIAAQLVLNVVEPQSSGIGGGGFLLHLDGARGEVLAYDGRETAPAAATPGLFLDATGRPLRFFDAVDGGLAVGTPGLLRMLEIAHRQHGRLPWAHLFAPAIRLAAEGFEVSPRLHRSIAASAQRICAQPRAAAYLLEPGSCVPRAAGSRLRNPALATTLRLVAAGGADAFYDGPIAGAIVDAVRTHPRRPGHLALADLRAYRAVVRTPTCASYRGHRICGMPPPSAGSIAVLQTLGMLEGFDLSREPPGSLETVHRMSEAYRLAYADRARHVADPAFVPVPVAGLLAPDYLAARAALIRADASLGAPPAGSPEGAVESGEEAPRAGRPSTTHLSIVDRQGNAVSMTTSIEHGFGSLQMAGGFLLNNQLTDFAFEPADARGRPVANRVEPGKRPRSSMAPMLVFGPDGRLVAGIGSPGGLLIIHYVTKTLVGLLDWGLDLQQAIDLPNFGAPGPAITLLERGSALETLEPALRARGHQVILTELNSGVHGFTREHTADGASDRWSGAADPRREGLAAHSAPARAAAQPAGAGERRGP